MAWSSFEDAATPVAAGNVVAILNGERVSLLGALEIHLVELLRSGLDE